MKSRLNPHNQDCGNVSRLLARSGSAAQALDESRYGSDPTILVLSRIRAAPSARFGPVAVLFRSGAHVRRLFVRMARGLYSPKLSVCVAGYRNR